MAQRNYFIITHRVTGKLLLDSGRLPIFWVRRTAKEVADCHNGYEVRPVSIDDFNKLLKAK